MTRPLIYISGPITKGQPSRMHNVAVATQAFHYLLKRGVYAFVPQWAALVDYCLEDCRYDEWMELDFAVIERCDVLVRLPGESKGADLEVEFATKLGIPTVFGDDWKVACDAVIEYLRSSGHPVKEVGDEV